MEVVEEKPPEAIQLKAVPKPDEPEKTKFERHQVEEVRTKSGGHQHRSISIY